MKTALVVVALFLVASVYLVWRRHQVMPLVAPEVIATVPSPKSSVKNLRPVSPLRLHRRVNISGTIKDRKVVSMVVPDYPEWAQVSGVSGNVSAKIWVHPGGNVSSFMQLTQMSTEPRLDEVALDALRQWQFSAAPAGSEKQSGIVTFRFVLENKRPPELALARLPKMRR